MHCYAFCLIALVLLSSMFAVMVDNNGVADRAFKAVLDPEQLDMYKTIHKKRLNIYLQGLALGILLALIYMYYNKYTGLIRVCILAAIVLGTAYLYYMIVDKKMMLHYLNNKEQVDMYVELYKSYRFKSTLGMILGVFGFIALGYAFT